MVGKSFLCAVRIVLFGSARMPDLVHARDVRKFYTEPTALVRYVWKWWTQPYKWDKASDGVVLQYSETTDYSTRAGGCSCRRNSCHCHRSPHPTEKLLAWSKITNLRRQTKWVPAFLSQGRATCLSSVCCGFGRFLMAVEFVQRTTWQVTNETTDPHDKHSIFCTRPHATPDFSYSYTCH